MSKKQRNISVVIIASLIIILLALILFVVPQSGEEESIKQVMKNEVLHEYNHVSLFGLVDVNPGFISAITVTAIISVFAIIVRIFFIPKFTLIPNKFQMLIEEAVGLFDNIAKSNSPHKYNFLGGYVFAAGVYIFIGTLFELFGFQAVSIEGNSVTMPAPLSDINGAIAMGFLTYLFIMTGGLITNGIRGLGRTLKDFSLPISMSFRLFGALISGALVSELVYHYIHLSFVLPVLVGVLFTLLHAVIQAYVLTMLAALFYGEATEPSEKKLKSKKG